MTAQAYGRRDERRWERIGRTVAEVGVLPILLVVLFLFFGLYEPKFWRAANIINVLRNASYLMIISWGQMMVLIIGGFDLSVGAVIALASITAALAMVDITPMFGGAVYPIIIVGVLAGLIAGALVGVVNGLCVAYLKVSPFMVTIGTMSIASGIALYRTTGVPIYGMPDEFAREFGRLRWLGLPVSIYIALIMFAVLWWVMNWTRLGRYIYAIGGNPHAARVSGIPTNFYLVATYALCALLAAVTGILLTARVGSGEATMGGTFMLQSIAAAVIGGVSLAGGVGRVEFVGLGALFLALVTNGMNLARVDSKMQTIVIGAVLILAVALDRFRRRKVT